MVEMILKLNSNVFNTISKIVSLQGINLKDYLAKTKNVVKKTKANRTDFASPELANNKKSIFDLLRCPNLELTDEEEQYFIKPDRTGNYREINL